MAGFLKDTPPHLVRSLVWSSQLKDILEDELQATMWVNWMTEFPDGDTFNIPSIGQFQADDYRENESIRYRALDTGNFTFSITEYLSSATFITKQAMQDQFYMSQLTSQFVPKQARAIMVRVEEDILGLSANQTASNLNTINGGDHRFVGSGTNEVIAPTDFARALHALKQANASDSKLIAIVDPSVEFELNTQTNLVNVSNNPRWEGIIADGIGKGMKFVKNVYGFDVFTSQRLADANETIDGLTTAAGKANLFFTAEADEMPFIGAWRQMPQVDSEFNKDKQREEHVTTARYGVDLFREETLVVCLTDTDQVG